MITAGFTRAEIDQKVQEIFQDELGCWNREIPDKLPFRMQEFRTLFLFEDWMGPVYQEPQPVTHTGDPIADVFHDGYIEALDTYVPIVEGLENAFGIRLTSGVLDQLLNVGELKAYLVALAAP